MKENIYFIDGVKFEKLKIRKNEYYDPVDGDILYFNPSKIDTCISLIKKYRISIIYFSYEFISEETIINDNLEDFLNNSEVINHIKSATINIAFYDNFIASFINLKELYILDSKIKKLDLSKHKKLEYLSLTWSKNITGFHELKNLKILRIWKLKENDFLFLKECKEIKKLEVYYSKIISTAGIQFIINLEELVIDNAPNMEIVLGISNNSKINSIRINKAKNLQNCDDIGNIIELNMLQISQVNNLKDLNFMNKIKRIDKCRIHPSNVKIRSNDYSPLKRFYN